MTLVEAELCGHGPSGRNGGFLHGYWSMLGWLRKVLGEAQALELARAGDGILPAMRALGEDVWLREAGMIEVATTSQQENVVTRATDTARELGVPEEAVRLSRDEVAARCRSPRFGSGVLFRECATVQPARLARALRRRALDADVEVFEHTPPTRVRAGVVETPGGTTGSVRELCDRYDILLSADEVITGFGRVGEWFGSERYDIRPDLICSAKGLSSSHAAIGAVIASEKVMEPFMQGSSVYMHGITFGGHPVMSAIALKNIEIMRRDKIVEGVREHEDAFRSTLAQLLELPIVGDLRGTGFFYALELVKDKETRETFNEEECESLLRGYLSSALFERGLICRADDRGDPVIQISPPLVARQEQFDEMVGILGDVLAEAGQRVGS